MPLPEPLQVVGPLLGLLVVALTHLLNGPFGTTILNGLRDYHDSPVRSERPGSISTVKPFAVSIVVRSIIAV
jgi:hypothetical protein